ncbi:MAG: hypothetical protein RIM23_11605, partial [Coleofasciculus sp. G3-WIS-01]
YLKKGGLSVVSYPKQALKIKDGQIRIPLGTLVKTWFKIADFFIHKPFHDAALARPAVSS